MTENKRFNLVGGYVYDKDKCISHFEDVKHRDEIIDLLNNLYDENEQLKSRVDYLERKIQRERASTLKQHEKWENEIQKENEQLKKQLKKKEVEPIVKALKERDIPYGHYTDNKTEKELKDLLKSKPLNCTGHWDGEH